MLIWDRELSEWEKNYNINALKNINIIDFMKGGNLIEVYSNLNMYIRVNRVNYKWSIGVNIDTKTKNRLNNLYKKATAIKEDIYYQCRDIIMKDVKYKEYKNIDDLSIKKQKEFKELISTKTIEKINLLQNKK